MWQHAKLPVLCRPLDTVSYCLDVKQNTCFLNPRNTPKIRFISPRYRILKLDQHVRTMTSDTRDSIDTVDI